ncbi:hypothetical protein ABPG75_006597 [Micractinium tetrahymenae]
MRRRKAPATCSPAVGLAIIDLPESLVSIVIELAVAGDLATQGPKIALVCKQWHRLLYESPAAWRAVRVTGAALAGLPQCSARLPDRRAWFDVRMRVLQRTAPLAREFEIDDRKGVLSAAAAAAGAGGWAVPDVLPLLSPQRLASLTVLLQLPSLEAQGVPLPPAVIDATPGFTGLTQLYLQGAELAGGTAAALAALPRLRDLMLGSRELPPEVVGAVTGLTRLTCLHLRTTEARPPQGLLQPLSRLARLRALFLFVGNTGEESDSDDEDDEEELLQMPPPSAFPQLRLANFKVATRMRLGGACLCTLGFGPQPGQGHAAIPELTGVTEMPSMAALPEAALPRTAPTAARPGLAPRLEGCGLGVQSVQGAARLASITGLQLEHCADGAVFQGDEGPLGALGTLLAQAPRLRQLALAQLRQLEVLELVDNWALPALPEGPYLAGLTALHLAGCCLKALPSSLAAATALECLGVHGNDELAFKKRDLAAVLDHLPRLRELAMGRATMCATQRVTLRALHSRGIQLLLVEEGILVGEIRIKPKQLPG